MMVGWWFLIGCAITIYLIAFCIWLYLDKKRFEKHIEEVEQYLEARERERKSKKCQKDINESIQPTNEAVL